MNMNSSLWMRVRVLSFAVLSMVTFGTSQASAQYRYRVNPYHHTYHPELGYIPHVGTYGYGGNAYGASGRGQFAAGLGQLHESNAKAQLTHQQAETEYLKNYGLAEKARIQTYDEGLKAAQKRRDVRLVADRKQVALYKRTMERMAAAHRLTAKQFDLDRGVLHWPFILRGAQYAALRLKLDQLYSARTPTDSGTNSSGIAGIQKACKQMMDIVKSEVRNGMPVTDFVTAKHFISSIVYESQFKVKPSK